MASETPHGRRPDEHVKLPSSDIVPTLQPVDKALHVATTPSAIPPLPGEPLRSYPPVVREPPKPQPGFWLGVLATLFMIITCQIAIPLVVAIGVLVVNSAGAADPAKRLQGMVGSKEGMREFNQIAALPLLISAHVPMILLGVVALRIFAGRQWYREVALRLPSLRHLVLLLLGFPALPILAGGAYWLAQRLIPGLGQFPALVASQLTMIGVLSAIWLVRRLQTGSDPKLELARSPIESQLSIGMLLALVGLATAFATLAAMAMVLPNIPALAEMDQSMEDLVEATRTWPLVVAVLVIAVMPAFSEEIWCRAFLGRGLVGQYGVLCGVVLTSYFFGAIHVLPHQGAMAMLVGLVLHFAYITTRSLLAPMLLHFLNNATSVLGPRLGRVAANIDTGPDRVPLSIYVCSLMLLAAVGWALYESRVRFVIGGGSTDERGWHPAYPGVALPDPSGQATLRLGRISTETSILVAAVFIGFAALFTLGTLGYRLP